jgi:tetratricopeptide (TPR) repeat protein
MSTQTAAKLLNEGYELEQKGDFTRAISKYQAVLDDSTDEQEIPMLACLNLGNIALNRRDQEMAMSWYRKAIAVNPTNDAPYYNLANVLRDLGRHSDAISHFKMAIERNPEDPDSRRNLALLYVSLGETALATSELKKCVELSPGADPRDYFNLGLLHYKAGNELGAFCAFEDFMKAAPAGLHDQVATARRLMDEIKTASFGGRPQQRIIFKDGRIYLGD